MAGDPMVVASRVKPDPEPLPIKPRPEVLDAAEEAFLRVYGHTRPGVREAMEAALTAAETMRERLLRQMWGDAEKSLIRDDRPG